MNSLADKIYDETGKERNMYNWEKKWQRADMITVTTSREVT